VPLVMGFLNDSILAGPWLIAGYCLDLVLRYKDVLEIMVVNL